MILLIKLILAHLAADFLLLPDSWAKAKEIKKYKAYQLYLNAFIYFALILIIVWDITFWKWALLLAGFHLIINIVKIYVKSGKTKQVRFIADQLIHILLIYLVWILSQDERLSFSFLADKYYLSLILFVYALTQPASALIHSLISKWSPETEGKKYESLGDAGKYIGILERLFVFTFVITNNWQPIGFLIAAKSIFRFGDLKDSKNIKLTEYVLIGTLISFGIAFLAGIGFQKLNNP